MRLSSVTLAALLLLSIYEAQGFSSQLLPQGGSLITSTSTPRGSAFDNILFYRQSSTGRVGESLRLSMTVHSSTEEPPRKIFHSKKRKQYKNSTRERSIAKGRDPIISLNMNLDYLGKSGQRGAAERAEALLRRIEALHSEGYYDIRPDTVSYNSVMNAYAIEALDGDKESANEAQRLLHRMEDLYDGTHEELLRPNVVSFNTAILALANSGQPEEAEELLKRMEDTCLADSDGVACMPNTITYNSCILAWAKAGDPHRAEDLLRQMMEVSLEREDDDLKADTIAFNTILYAWAVSREKGAAERAQKLLRHMERLYHAGNDDVKPDTISYTSVIAAWASSREPVAADRALALLDEMETLYESGDKDAKPNAYSYTACINAISRSGLSGSAHMALEMLQRMEGLYKAGHVDCKPDIICYSSVIDAYSKSGHEDAVERAVELLNAMIEMYEAGDIEMKPNTRTYCAVIATLGRSAAYGAAENAEKILDDMERMHAFGDEDVKPNTAVFNAVIDAYARSSYKKKAERAQYLLLRMLEESAEGNRDILPDVITYNSVIKACANAFGNSSTKKKAFLIALDAFKRLHKSKSRRNQQTSITYSLFIKAVRKLIPVGEERDTILQKIIKFCINDGLVNRQVLFQMQAACGEPNVLLGMLASHGHTTTDCAVDVKDLPSDWTCNARR